MRSSVGERALALRHALGFGLAYALVAYVARLTVVDGQAVSWIWPGAGVAVLWLLAESPRHQWRVLAPLVLIHSSVAWLTDAPLLLLSFGAMSLAFQTWLTVALLRRWCPSLLGAGGTESFRSPRILASTCAAAVVGSAAGAVIGTVGAVAAGLHWDWLLPVAWFSRHVTGILVVGCVGHLAWEWRTRRVVLRTRGGSRSELIVLWVVSVAAVVATFEQPYPLAFLVVPLCVWSAARFPTFLAALHALMLGLGGVTLTLAGDGPFTQLGEPVVGVVLAQVFLVTVMLTALSVGTLSDRIDELMARTARARARAAEQAELLQEMTESMDEGLIVLDREGGIDRSNGASRRLARRVSPGLPDAAALAALVELVLHPDVDHTGAARAELGIGDVQVPLSSGEDLVIAVSRTALAPQQGEASRRGVLLVLREVTEHRHGLRPLVSFASTAAHDLRGPLTAIGSWLDLATEGLEPEGDNVASIRRAEKAARRMADLIDDLLEHAVAEAGDLVAHDVALAGERGVLSAAAALLGPDDVLEVPDDLPRVRADETALKQLFANLVGNAVKYARPGVPAHIRVSARSQGARVVVDVTDNGMGVAEDERAVIFERFHRSDSVRARRKGTGIGLSICQTIVTRHGGTIECLPAEPGPGTVFRLDLPATEPPRTAPASAPAIRARETVPQSDTLASA